MTTQATQARPLRVLRLGYVASACALALAAAAAVGASSLVRGGGEATTVARQYAAMATARPEPAVTFYLVGSEAQKSVVLQAEDDAAAIRANSGDLETMAVPIVVVASDDRSEQLAFLGLMDANAYRFGLRLAEMTLVDLRAGDAR